MSNTKCKYCNSGSYGKISDNRHPKGVHEHASDGEHCIYCGTKSLGRVSDSRHPDHVHER